MKTKMLLIMMVFGLNALIAQTTPVDVTSKFEKDYPNTSGTWSTYKDYYRVEYNDIYTDTWRAIVYDKTGCVVCQDWKVTGNYNYPPRIADWYKATYPGEAYVIWSSLSPGGAQLGYYIVRNGEPIWFCGNGKVKCMDPHHDHHMM